MVHCLRSLLFSLPLRASRFLFRTLGLFRPSLHWNFATCALGLRDRNGDAQYSILKFGPCVFSIRTVGESDGSIELSVAALGPLDSSLVLFLLDLAFALNDQKIIVDLHFDVLFAQAG